MRHFKNILLTSITLLAFFSSEAFAQGRSCHLWLNNVPLVADTVAGRIYATIEPEAPTALKATLTWDDTHQKVVLNTSELAPGEGNFSVSDWSDATENILTITDNDGTEKQWTMVFTTLPIILVEAKQSKLYEVWKKDNNKKSDSYIQVLDARCRTKMKDSDPVGMPEFCSNIGIRVRGATSAGKEKKSFAIELRTEDGEELNAHLLGYRKDGDWILDAMFNDFSKMRNRVITDIWNTIDDLPYDKDNDYQHNGTSGEYVEVFLQGKYWGMYCFTDKIDRKKLNLKKYQEATDTEDAQHRGLLWKATFRCSTTTLSSYDDYPTNDTLVWEDYWVQKYPDDRQDQGYFTPIANAIDKVGRASSEATFYDNMQNVFFYDNVINYMIFTQAFQLMDNLQKNYYLSVRNHNKEDRLLITPWDLDASMGRNAGGDPLNDETKWMAFGEQLGGINYLFWRLKTKRPNDFATRFNNRWQYLKTHELSLENIRARMEKYAELFSKSGAWKREYDFCTELRRSSGKQAKMTETPQEEVEFIIEFLERNYAVFDEKVASWNPGEYTEPEPDAPTTEASLYIVAPDVKSTHEDNTTIMPGNVSREPIDGIQSIDIQGEQMVITREDGTTAYPTTEIKEVKTSADGLYPTPAFIPEALRGEFDFDTQYSTPGLDDTEAKAAENDGFTVQRTLQVNYDGDKATFTGNLSGFEVENEGANVVVTTQLEGVKYIVNGTTRTGTLTINSTSPCKITTLPGSIATMGGISANCDVIVNNEGALNLIYEEKSDESVNNNYTLLHSTGNITILGGVLNCFNTAFNGKDIHAEQNFTMEGGCLHLMAMGSGTVTDDNFTANPALGTRAVLANNVDIKGGKLCIKTLGDNGGVGLAGKNKVMIEGGENYLACYDDPVKGGNSVDISGGFILTSSLTNDGMDSKGSFHFSGGTTYSYGPEGAEGAFDNNGKTFSVNGGTIIGVAYKSDSPQASKSTQPSLILKKSSGIKKYVRVETEDGTEIISFETPAYSTLTLVISDAKLVKGQTYVITTSSNGADFTEVKRLTAN